jgi:Peptidase A4 family
MAGAVGLATAIPSFVATSSASANPMSPSSSPAGSRVVNHGAVSCVVPDSVPQVPDGGLDPGTVSASQLGAFGLPQRPNPGGTQPQWWNKLVSSVKHVVVGCPSQSDKSNPPPPDLGTVSVPGSEQLSPKGPSAPDGAAQSGTSSQQRSETVLGSTNWAGYQDTGGSSTYPYQVASGEMTIPSVGADDNEYSTVSSWVGIGTGDSSSDQLIQAGVETDADPGVGELLGLWVEMYPGVQARNSYELVQSFPGAGAGNELYLAVYNEKPYALFDLFDVTTGEAMAIQLDNSSQCPYNEGNTDAVQVCSSNIPKGGYSSGSTAEYIVEDPSGDYYPLGFFAMVPFESAVVEYKSHDYSISQRPNDAIYMYNPYDDALWAYPGGFSTAGAGCTTSDAFCVYRTANS